MRTITIDVINEKAYNILHELEALKLIKVHAETPVSNEKLSDQLKGILTKEQGKDLNDHISKMRGEWNSI